MISARARQNTEAENTDSRAHSFRREFSRQLLFVLAKAPSPIVSHSDTPATRLHGQRQDTAG